MNTASNTLDDFPAETFAILAFCEDCGRQAPIDRSALPRGLTVAALRRRLRCAGCGSRETSIRIVYTGAGGFRYGMQALVRPRRSTTNTQAGSLSLSVSISTAIPIPMPTGT